MKCTGKTLLPSSRRRPLRDRLRAMTNGSLSHFQLPLPNGAKQRGVRDPGDAWVIAHDGNRYWGRFGAAGLLAVDQERGILMQHRVDWSDHGGTWGIPGGAINQGEQAINAAVREAHEEAGVPHESVESEFMHVVDRGGWSYTTVVARVLQPFEPAITDPESFALAWVRLDDVTNRELHPGFARSWPALRRLIEANTPSTDESPDESADESVLRELLSTLNDEGHAVTDIRSRD